MADVIEAAPEPDVDAQPGDGLLHIMCCDDHDLALCGKDISNHPYMARGELPDCETCARLEEKDPGTCIVRRSPLCPLNVLGGDAP